MDQNFHAEIRIRSIRKTLDLLYLIYIPGSVHRSMTQ